jgi:hypothetical protein
MRELQTIKPIMIATQQLQHANYSTFGAETSVDSMQQQLAKA